ncbi:MAG: oligoendopeptidase F [Eubacteriales bacterium]|nr:oligoendopeptidase F [Eubacteriales bacterium]
MKINNHFTYQKADGEGAKAAPKRSEVDPKICWDLSLIYKNLAEWEKDFTKVKDSLPKLQAYQGKLAESAEQLASFLKESENCSLKMAQVYVYSSMLSDQDKSNSENASLVARAGSLYAQFAAALSFYEPELIAAGKERMEELIAQNEDLKLYKHKLEQMLRTAEHILSAREEEILATASEVLSSGSKVFSVLNNADLKFPDVKDSKGELHPLNHATFGTYLREADRELRKNSFEAMYKVYEQFRNTLAMTLSQQMKNDNLQAELRGFDSARAAALFANAIDESVPDNLIKIVNENIGLLHRFVTLKKKLAKLDELHCYDLYLPAYEDSGKRYSIEEAAEIILEATKPLGDDYQKIIKRAFDEKWIDFPVNQGKRSGAYSSGSYTTRPYILMSWQGTMDNLFTLAHELGHSAHSFLTRREQPAVYGSYPIFLAEIASTTNENLLTQYLLGKADTEEEKNSLRFNWLDGFKGTVFRQTQFAEFEHFVHLKDQEGVALSADFLSDHYAELNKRYYGPDLFNDPLIRYEWARIPHFYYNYYVYQYATGFAAAISFSELITNGGAAEREAYLGFLSAGCSDYPLEILAKAGVDMRETKPLEIAMQRFEAELSQFEKSLDA